MSLMSCAICGEIKDTDLDSGTCVCDYLYVCEYCAQEKSDDELIKELEGDK